MIFLVFMFGIGLFLLIWGSSLFVDSAVKLANHLHLPEVLIGATIVSLGTTLPEVLFSMTAATKGLTEMALGNALGSILCNTGFIAGFMILLQPIDLEDKEVKNIILGAVFLAIGFFIYLISGILTGQLTRLAGLILLGVCILYLRSTVKNVGVKKQEGDLPSDEASQNFGVSDVILVFLEMMALYLGANILVKYGPQLALSIGIPQVIVSLTFVALGTSLPEFITSLVAIAKRHTSLSLGNIIGADVLNFLFVGAGSALICPIVYPKSILILELPFIFLLLSLLCIPSILQKKASRLQGILLLGSYVLYLYQIFV